MKQLINQTTIESIEDALAQSMELTSFLQDFLKDLKELNAVGDSYEY